MADLQLNALSVARGNRLVIRPLNWRLGRGEIGLVHGSNGSGKTTLLRCLAGLGRVASGGFAINGISPPSRDLPQQSYYIGHRNALVPGLTARANLRRHASLLGQPNAAADAALAYLGCVGLADWEIGQLSQGQQRRIALARLGLVVAQHHRLWLLDEPYAGLDSEAVACIAQRIGEYCAAGGTVLLSSHARPDAAEAMAGVKVRGLSLGG